VDLLEEAEQWESLKAWFRENGLAIVAGALVGVLALFGWRWWQSHTEQQQAGASAAYEKLLTGLDTADIDQGMKDLEQFRKDHAGTAYESAAALEAARIHVARNELDKAVAALRGVVDGAKDPQLKSVARLRLARVQIAQGKPDDAITTLGKDDAGAFKALVAEVRGDALQAKGDAAGALREYEAAKVARGDVSATRAGDMDLLELKINDLKGAP
jgi:predicted negative regulator of RcsB-dependent stress response